MRAYVTAMLVATTAISGGGIAWAQSSSPFSGLFSRDDPTEGPVDLDITVEGGNDTLATRIRQTSLIAGALSEDRHHRPGRAGGGAGRLRAHPGRAL